MPHILIKQPDGRAIGFQTPEDCPLTNESTLIHVRNYGYQFVQDTGYWFSCEKCKEWVSESQNFPKHDGRIIGSYGVSARRTPSGKHICERCHRRLEASPGGVQAAQIVADIPPEYVMWTMPLLVQHGTLRRQDAAVIQQWPKDLPFMSLVGVNGVGKTSVLYAMQQHLAQSNIRVAYFNGNEMRKRWEGMMPDGRNRAELAIINAPYVQFDEFSCQNMTPGWITTIQRIIDARIKYRRPIMLAGKVGPKDLVAMLSSDVVSRLKFFKWHPIIGKDHRSEIKPISESTPDA